MQQQECRFGQASRNAVYFRLAIPKHAIVIFQVYKIRETI